MSEPTAADPWTVTLAWTPDQNFGAVSVMPSRTPAAAIIGLVRAGEDPGEVAAEYGCSYTEVRVLMDLATQLADLPVGERVCALASCGTKLVRRPREGSTAFAGRRFCSVECASLSRRSPIGEDGRVCGRARCGARLVQRPSEDAFAFRRRRFCSASCSRSRDCEHDPSERGTTDRCLACRRATDRARRAARSDGGAKPARTAVTRKTTRKTRHEKRETMKPPPKPLPAARPLQVDNGVIYSRRTAGTDYMCDRCGGDIPPGTRYVLASPPLDEGVGEVRRFHGRTPADCVTVAPEALVRVP